MKKDITLDVALFDNGTVEMKSSGYVGQNYNSGTVEFTATIDGRRKTFDPMAALKRAGLATTDHDGNMFPDYKATDKFYKSFTNTGLVLCFTDTIATQERLNSIIKETGANKQQAFTNLKNVGVTTMANVYQLSDTELKTIILK